MGEFKVTRNSPEWFVMWNTLARHDLNQEMQDPRTCTFQNEAWSYLGTGMNEDGVVVHRFEHPIHPLTCSPETVDIPMTIASPSCH